MLVIVRDEAAIYHVLTSADIDPRATIIVDRRAGERRQQVADGFMERRVGDRRGRPDVAEALERDGLAVVETGSAGVDSDDARA